MNIQLEILVPDETALQVQVTGLRATDASGNFGLLPNHEPFLTLLVPCILQYRDTDQQLHYAAVDGGLLISEGNRTRVVTREAVLADELAQVADAAAAMLRARTSAERGARAEFAELQAALVRQLRVVEKHA